MIIACPECTSPFQVEDGDIAPLVQVECPTCKFRMILDFEAANDASLVEEGMGMAQGFFSEADYRQAVGAGALAAATPAATAPHLHAVSEPEPAIEPEPAPEPTPVQPVELVAVAPEPRTPPTQPPPEHPPVRQPPVQVEPTPEPTPVVEPVQLDTPAAAVDKPPVRIPRPPVQPDAGGPEVQRSARATLIAYTAPPPAQRPPTPVTTSEPEDIPVDIDADVEQPSVEVRPTHVPPHTPPVDRPPVAEPEPPRPVLQVPPTEQPTKPEETKPEQVDKPKRSVVGTILLVILLLLVASVAGLLGWAFAETGSPDPRPLLQDKFGITF